MRNYVVSLCSLCIFLLSLTAQTENTLAAGQQVPNLATVQKAAEQGDAKAQVNLGLMYANGRGVPQDYARATLWFKKAAEQGYARGQFNLGVAYNKGYGVPQDYARAAQWLKKAAEQGHVQGQFNLGKAYAEGQGVPQDYALAKQWYQKAAQQGDERAKQALERLQTSAKNNNQEATKPSATATPAEDRISYEISPDGELAEMFSLGSKYTDLQRETKLEELKGKTIEWTLPVYEISRRSDGKYSVITSGLEYVGCVIRLTATSDADKRTLLALKTGDRISVRGTFSGETTFRNLEIKDAVLIEGVKTYTYQEEGAEGELTIFPAIAPDNEQHLRIFTVNKTRYSTCDFEGKCRAKDKKLICRNDVTHIEILIKNNTLDLIIPDGSDVQEYCGLGAYFSGKYRRK